MSKPSLLPSPACWLLVGGVNEADTTGRSQRELQELQRELESTDPVRKIAAMKRVVRLITNGVAMPNLLMTVIRYCMVTDNHELKKLLLLYWESVPKVDESGSLRPEMVLVINALLSDLNHPNEFVRGCTLRFLCRIHEANLINHLVAPVKNSLAYRHAYVRRQAALAMATMRVRFGEDMLPDAEELLEAQLAVETDAPTRRNMFLGLMMIDPARALRFFVEHADQTLKYGDGYCLVLLELARRVCRADPAQKGRFIKTVLALLQSESDAVTFEAAWTLCSLSAAPTAVRAATQTFTHLLHVDSDNNVKLVVLEKLAALQKAHPKILQEHLMDMLRALSSPNSDIRRKTLEIAMELVTRQNVDEVVLILKKEVVKTQAKDVDKTEAAEYRRMLVHAIHSCAVKFPAVAASVVHVLMDFLNGDGALDVIVFVRELIETQPTMRSEVVSKLIDCLGEIRAGNVARAALWIVGEYAEEAAAGDAVRAVFECLGPLPFQPDAPAGSAPDASSSSSTGGGRPAVELTTTVTVLPDGTYATQTALTEAHRPGGADDDADSGPALRKLILDGDYFLGAVCVVALTKLALKSRGSADVSTESSKHCLDTLLLACGMLNAGDSVTASKRIDADSRDRIDACVRVLLDGDARSVMSPILLGGAREVYTQMLAARRVESDKAKRERDSEIKAQPFEVISFRQLRGKSALGAGAEHDLDDDGQMALAVKGSGAAAGASSARNFASKTNKRVNVHMAAGATATGGADAAAGTAKSERPMGNIHALTGGTDPIYIEATVAVHDFDITIDFLVINRTDQTVTNVDIELCVVGDLKITERHAPFSMGPRDYRTLTTSIKVSSTETGHIFGNVSFDHPQQMQTTIIALQEIYIDIMNYIRPATCSDSEFRAMWAEFEWENKVAVFTVITDCKRFLEHIRNLTNMNCLTPDVVLDDSCDFLAANLFAQSVFGEAALLNVSIERNSHGKIEGYIRIRAKLQGIALSLGDRITMRQRSVDL